VASLDRIVRLTLLHEKFGTLLRGIAHASLAIGRRVEVQLSRKLLKEAMVSSVYYAMRCWRRIIGTMRPAAMPRRISQIN